MTPETRQRLAVLVERHLAGLLGPTESEELSKLLATSAEARELYFGSLELHMDLQSILLATTTEETTMARISLKCVCGWTFFVPGTAHEAFCSNCGGAVPIPGRQAGGGAPRKSRPRTLLLVSAAAAILLISVILLVAGGSPPPGEGHDAARRSPPPPAANTGPARPIAKEPPKPQPGPASPRDPAPVAPPVPAVKEAPTPVAPAPMDLPAEIVKTLRDDLRSLKEWHVNLALTAPEKARMDALISTGKGLAGDVDFLKGLAESARLRAVKEEAGLFRETFARLEKEALEALPVDKVTMNDGRILHGRIVEETEDLVKLERKFAGGVIGVLSLPKSGIKEVQRGKGLGTEFKTRWEEARKAGPGKMGSLLAWCKSNTLPLQASLAAYALLVDNPGMAEARGEAGFAADPVSRMLEAEKQGGFITHEGRRWVPKELKDKLIRDGFVIVDGKWVSRKDKLIGVPGLFRYETQADKPVLITGSMVAHDEVVTYVTVQDLTTNAFVEKPEIKLMRRFYAAVPLVVTASRAPGLSTHEVDTYIIQDRGNPSAGTLSKSEVFLTIPVGAPLLEASVMTSAEVKSGGSITVSLVLDGNRTPLYTCGAKEDKAHKIPTELIRGKTEVQLVAEITSRATYRQKTETKRVRALKKDGNRVLQKAVDVTYNQLIPEYQAVLFPSNSNTVEVFRLTAVCGDPSPGLDKLFENARDVLK